MQRLDKSWEWKKKNPREESDDFVPDSFTVGLQQPLDGGEWQANCPVEPILLHINPALLRFLSSLTITPVSSHSAYY